MVELALLIHYCQLIHLYNQILKWFSFNLISILAELGPAQPVFPFNEGGGGRALDRRNLIMSLRETLKKLPNFGYFPKELKPPPTPSNWNALSLDILRKLNSLAP